MSDLYPAESTRPLRVFLVENHADTREWLARYVESLGHAVTTAGTMAEALALLPQGRWDVLVSDIGLPDGDGWELLRTARLRQPIYAIAMSGFGPGSDRVRSKAAGYRRHLLKPFVPEALDEALDEAARELTGVGAA